MKKELSSACRTTKAKTAPIEPIEAERNLLEIENVTMEDVIDFPPFLKALREVTDDTEWYNANIAKRK